MEERKGFQDWGLLIKVGSVDPLMKVQARGLLRSFYSDGSAVVVGEKEGGKVGAMERWRRGKKGGAVRCGPRSTDSSSSYAPDGQGRYTTTVYFRLPSISFSPPSIFCIRLSSVCVCVQKGGGGTIEGSVDNEEG